MRILHTSDWHLGATHCDRPRAAEQEHFLKWLLRAVQEHEVDVVVIAGDVFDTANPPAEALAAYYRFLASLAALEGPTRSGGGRTALVVGGNHDSPARLDAPREPLRALQVHVVGGYDAARADEEHGDAAGALVPLRGAGGEVALVVAAVPFLNDWRLGVRGFDATTDEQLGSMHDAFGGVYGRLAERASAAFPGAPLIATGHLTCFAERGRRATEEDAIPNDINRVGTLGAMAPTIFDERYRYVALGHIHRGFAVDGEGRVQYSGTPLQVGTAEGADSRRVLLVDVDAGGVSVRPLNVPVRRRLLKVHGPLDAVVARLRSLSVGEGELPPYVSVDLELTAPDLGIEKKLREAAPTGAFEIVSVRSSVARQGGAPEGGPRAPSARDLSPEDAFDYAWRAKFGRDARPSDAVLQRFRSLLEGDAARSGRSS